MYIFKEQAVVISNLHSSKAYTAYQTNPIEPYKHQQVFKPVTFMIISQHKKLNLPRGNFLNSCNAPKK